MKTPADGWTDEERDALVELEPELEAMQRRHAGDPPLDLLRAARAGVLSEPLQTTLGERLHRTGWDRALVDGAEHADVGLDEHSQAGMLRRVQREATRERAGRPSFARWWQPVIAAAAVLLLIAVGSLFVRENGVNRPVKPPAGRITADRRLTAPVFVLPLDPPEIKLSAAALVFRGRAGDVALLNDLKPALDAFRAGDYAAADRVFVQLTPRYPTSVEVAFYGGVARLLSGDAEGAIARLEDAERIGDAAFAGEIRWYRAVAEERAGRREQARTRLAALCRMAEARSPQACASMEALK